MGEVVEDMLEGLRCQNCGEWFHDDEEAGFPRSCESCKDDESIQEKKRKKASK